MKKVITTAIIVMTVLLNFNVAMAEKFKACDWYGESSQDLMAGKRTVYIVTESELSHEGDKKPFLMLRNRSGLLEVAVAWFVELTNNGLVTVRVDKEKCEVQ